MLFTSVKLFIIIIERMKNKLAEHAESPDTNMTNYLFLLATFWYLKNYVEA